MKEECSRYINFDINELIRILYRFIFYWLSYLEC